MKRLLIGAIALLSTTSLHAQIIDDAKQPKPPLLIGGMYVGGHITMEQSQMFDYPNMLSANTGLFMRCFIGQHFAIEASYDVSRSEKTFGAYPSPYLSQYYTSFSVYNKGFSIPVTFQYHLQRRDAALRPFFGLGLGYSSVSYEQVNNTRNSLNGSTDVSTSTFEDQSLFAQVVQGLTYQFNQHLQLSQYSYYKYRSNFGRSDVGIRVGLGYTIM